LISEQRLSGEHASDATTALVPVPVMLPKNCLFKRLALQDIFNLHDLLLEQDILDDSVRRELGTGSSVCHVALILACTVRQYYSLQSIP